MISPSLIRNSPLLKGATPTPARDAARVAGWVASRLPLLEAMLEGAVADLGPDLGEVRAAVGLAVGTRGRGGRRWRPLLTLAAAEACGCDPTRVLGVAAAVELTHTASLILDDLPSMDDADERRGLPSTHRLVGEASAILIAIGLIGRAAELIARAPAGGIGVIGAWGDALGLRGMSGGQVIDIHPSGAGADSGARRRLHRRKTTALSELALSAGGWAAGASDTTCKALEAFGRDIGWAYQLVDDTLDRVEDLNRGRRSPARKPVRQSRLLVNRAIRGIENSPGLTREGRELLCSFARVIVRDPTAGEGSPRRSS